ncbi:MAG: PD40 domain-containing protein [Deltaproteobacteria bacterium]|nr:PD40 domain-containing protein [Deltaproteobacteria bacterium]
MENSSLLLTFLAVCSSACERAQVILFDSRDAGAASSDGSTIDSSSADGSPDASSDGEVADGSVQALIQVELMGPGAPADARDRFARDPRLDLEPGPLIIYPSDETTFPMNIVRTLFQWRADARQDLFELRLESGAVSFRYYTRDRFFQMDEATREIVARSNRGRVVSVVVRSLSMTSTSSEIYRSRSIEVQYSEQAVPGSIYYWSTGAAAIMRASLESRVAERFYPAEGDSTCGSCHTVSRDGRRIALGYGGERLRVASIPDRAVQYPTGSAQSPEFGWGTFGPLARELLYASKGVLERIDLETGTRSVVALPASTFATHPDWSPDGRQIAVSVGSARLSNKEVKGTSLARIQVAADGSLGAPEVLVASTGPEDTIAFPSHSPDGRWIAFVRTVGKSKDSTPAQLYLVPSDGSAPPIQLERLNHRVRHEDGIRSTGNSMPTWAPATRGAWIAFSSIRAYGDVVSETNRDQLWASAIDLDRAAAGLDPSAAAFWLPFQETAEGNHRAFWSLNPEDTCPSTIELCDGFDDDCDGVPDDACCTPSAETCGNQADDDCDGAIDEACCGAEEICSNGPDDDCDGLADILDEDCAP